MPVYIILFRGVGGATQLPTKPLKEALTQAGFENATTYINSGNAVVKSRLGRAKVIEAIAKLCREQFGFKKAIYAPTLAEWEALIAANPFPQAVGMPKYLHAALLEEKPDSTHIAAVKMTAADGEEFEVVGNVAYIHTPNGFGTSKFAAKFDKAIGVGNTARNWNSVLKLRDLAKAAQ